MRFTDGAYHLTGFSGSISTYDFTDGLLEVEVEQIRGVATSYSCLEFRIPMENLGDAHGYRLYVGANNHWKLIRRTTENQNVDLTPWGRAPTFATGEGARNRIGVVCNGGDIRIMINGQEVGRVNDGVYPSGRVALMSGPGAEYAFRNLRIDPKYKLPQANGGGQITLGGPGPLAGGGGPSAPGGGPSTGPGNVAQTFPGGRQYRGIRSPAAGSGYPQFSGTLTINANGTQGNLVVTVGNQPPLTFDVTFSPTKGERGWDAWILERHWLALFSHNGERVGVGKLGLCKCFLNGLDKQPTSYFLSADDICTLGQNAFWGGYGPTGFDLLPVER